MKKLGMVGGVAWPSTIDYYKAICRLSLIHHQGSAISGPPPVPEMTIESLNINKSFGLRGGSISDDASWAGYDQYFREALQRLEANGADLAIIASNTPHNRYASITSGITIPVLSLFEAVAKECARMGVTEMLILGTAPTMDSPVFPEVLSRFGVNAYAPSIQAERTKIVSLISELYVDRDDDAAVRIRNVVDASFPKDGTVRAVCLACTELPLAFPSIEGETDLVLHDIRYINTTMIHAKAAFSALLQPSERC
jgi:aspartate racemase